MSGLKFQKIVMIDDTLDFVKSVRESCKALGIEFQGYHYQGAQEKPFERVIALHQVRHLVERGTWLTDDDVRGRLTN